MPRVRTSPPGPAWKLQWPRNGDLKSWYRAMIRKCEAIPGDDAAATAAHLPIEHLAGVGCVKEALRSVDRFLRRLPKREVLASVRMAELGAKICLDANDLKQMEKYLAYAESTEPFNIRKCDKGFSINSVRKFRVDNGLLDSADAVDEKQRLTARFERCRRQFKLAMAAGERKIAIDAIVEMEVIARESDDKWWRESSLRQVIRCHADLRDSQSLMKCIQAFTAHERREILSAHRFAELGMQEQAVERARQDIEIDLEEVHTKTDTNFLIPLRAIGRSLKFLVKQGAVDEARRSLHRILNECHEWPALRQGLIGAVVCQTLAEAVAMIDGPAAAMELLQQAMNEAKNAKQSDFRLGAINEILELKANIGLLDEAIDDARKLRSRTLRRKNLASLLAKARRWSELQDVLRQVESPEEAANMAWRIKFELPGGEVE